MILGTDADMIIKELMKIYPEGVAITAIVLFVMHLIHPYIYIEKFPYDDPLPKFLGPFSLGELMQYIIQVLTFPIILFAVIPLKSLGKVRYIVIMILLCIWWGGPRMLARKIDGW